ncbi:MAG TPA: hypothetical protein ENL08_04720, partial [Bacteroidetes bacterium]|nr:hypothetical protein [Bacteroidota bacterium]
MTGPEKASSCSAPGKGASCTYCASDSAAASIPISDGEGKSGAEALKDRIKRRRLFEVGGGLMLVLAGGLSRGMIPAEVIPSIMLVMGMIIAGYPIVQAGIKAALKLRLDINFLMTAAVVGGLAIGEWSEAAAVVILFAIAEMLEDFSLDRSRRAIEKLMELAPSVALVIRDNTEVEVPVADLQIGDTVLIKPGVSVPVDGTIVSGRSSLNLAAITGESMPVSCRTGDRALSGGINGEGSLIVKVSKKPDEFTINRIISLVQKAQEEKPRIHTIVERFAAYYTPIV